MAIITLTEYKTATGINNPNNDAKLTSIVDFVSAYIEKFTGQTFTSVVVTNHRMTSIDGLELVLPHAFVTSIEEIRENGNESADAKDPEAYILEPETGIVTAVFSFTKNRLGVEIDYTYGQTVVPADLKHAAVEWVTYIENREFHKVRSIGGQQSTFADGNSIPKHVRVAMSINRIL